MGVKRRFYTGKGTGDAQYVSDYAPITHRLRSDYAPIKLRLRTDSLRLKMSRISNKSSSSGSSAIVVGWDSSLLAHAGTVPGRESR